MGWGSKLLMERCLHVGSLWLDEASLPPRRVRPSLGRCRAAPTLSRTPACLRIRGLPMRAARLRGAGSHQLGQWTARPGPSRACAHRTGWELLSPPPVPWDLLSPPPAAPRTPMREARILSIAPAPAPPPQPQVIEGVPPQELNGAPRCLLPSTPTPHAHTPGATPGPRAARPAWCAVVARPIRPT
jgi:hypothetical protein